MTNPDKPNIGADTPETGDDSWDSWVDATEAKQPARQQPRACGTEPHL